MNTLAKKIAGLLPELEARGPVYLFAVVERDDIDLLDVVISSEWSDREMSASVHFVVDTLASRLKPQEMLMISRVVALPSGGESTFLDLPEGAENVSSDDEKVVVGNFLGLDIRRAFIIKSQPSPRIPAANEPARAVEFA